MADGTLEPGVKEAVEAVSAVAHMPLEMARAYLEMLGHAATKFMRAKFGPEQAALFVRAYAEVAGLSLPALERAA